MMISGFAVPYNPARHACIYRERWHILGYDSSRADHGTFVNHNPIEDSSSCPDPDVIFNHDSYFCKRLFPNWQCFIIEAMVRRDDYAMRSYPDPISNFQATMPIQNAIGVYATFVTDLDPSPITEKEGATVYLASFTNRNFATKLG